MANYSFADFVKSANIVYIFKKRLKCEQNVLFCSISNDLFLEWRKLWLVCVKFIAASARQPALLQRFLTVPCLLSSVMSFRHVNLSGPSAHRSFMSVRHICPSHLSVMSVCHVRHVPCNLIRISYLIREIMWNRISISIWIFCHQDHQRSCLKCELFRVNEISKFVVKRISVKSE